MRPLPAAALLLMAITAPAAPGIAGPAPCPPTGQWVDAASEAVAPVQAVARLAAAAVILLGERHGTPGHHRWQAETVAALAGIGPVVIGLEQLPPEAQPALDRFVAGTTDEAGFLAESRWEAVWGHDFAAYRPLFDLARTRAIPMVAINVDRGFVRQVGRAGYAAAAADGRAPVGRPAPPPAAYAASLAESFRQHAHAAGPEALARFIEAQTVWDRAMAEAIVRARIARPDARIVAVTGWGHVAHGHGIAHQLADLGERAVASAIAVGPPPACEPGPGSADLLFGANEARVDGDWRTPEPPAGALAAEDLGDHQEDVGVHDHAAQQHEQRQRAVPKAKRRNQRTPGRGHHARRFRRQGNMRARVGECREQHRQHAEQKPAPSYAAHHMTHAPTLAESRSRNNVTHNI